MRILRRKVDLYKSLNERITNRHLDEKVKLMARPQKSRSKSPAAS